MYEKVLIIFVITCALVYYRDPLSYSAHLAISTALSDNLTFQQKVHSPSPAQLIRAELA